MNDELHIGGMCWPYHGLLGTMPWPFAKLVLHADSLTLGSRWGRGILRYLQGPTFEVPYRDVVRAERVGGRLPFSDGVRFFLAGTNRRLIFWTFRPVEALAALETRGVPCDRQKHRVGFIGV